MAKPSIVPSWATTLANDPTTGQPNRAEPSVGKKVTGFNFNEKPPRQDMNWLLWIASKWIEYFDGVIDQDVRSGASPSFVAANITTLTVSTIYRAGGILINCNNGSDILTLRGGLIVRDSTNSIIAAIDKTNGDLSCGSIDANIIVAGGKFSAEAATNAIAGSDTGITGTELETLSNGSNADSLHKHSTANLDDTTATGANLNTLTAGASSSADALHTHTNIASAWGTGRNTSTQVVNHGYAALTFNESNLGTEITSPSTSELKVSNTGKYEINISLNAEDNTYSGGLYGYIYINDGMVAQLFDIDLVAGVPQHIGAFRTLALTANDIIKIVLYAAGDPSTVTTSYYCILVRKLGV
jgi:hypothetical protein